ncbi:hypothetical protein [Nitrosomonas sp.]|nr:hypothetical protein [Nitrosomonas sp.]
MFGRQYRRKLEQRKPIQPHKSNLHAILGNIPSAAGIEQAPGLNA